MAGRRRPDFTQAVRALIEHAARTFPQFQHIDAGAVLIVAGEARRASRGTVKPMAFRNGSHRDTVGRKKPLVTFLGKRVLYTITLRPLFFRKSTPRQRVATVLHELFHISRDFDGTLDHKRRHDHPGGGFEAEFGPLERRCWRTLPPEVAAPFAWNCEVRILQWLEKPQSWLPGEKASHRRRYNEQHLFEGVVRIRTIVRPPKKALVH